MSFLKKSLESVLACSGPASVLFHIHLFEKYFDQGTSLPDELHSVALNNHGARSYITEAQSHNLDLSIGGAAMMLTVFFAMVLWKVWKKPESCREQLLHR